MDICHKLDPDCKACSKPVYWKKRIFYLNKLWHLNCFKCSKCKIQLNTDVDIDDQQYSKAFLGEDYALRCFKCNNIFEQKKLAKLPYRKSNLLNYYENELINEYNNLEQHFYSENDDNKFNYNNLKDNNQHIKLHCKNYQHHKCYKNYTDLTIENDDDGLQKFINQHKCIEHCKQHKYLLKKKCSLTKNLIENELEDDDDQLTNKPANSLDIYKPLFKKDKNCNCTGCKNHIKNLKIK